MSEFLASTTLESGLSAELQRFVYIVSHDLMAPARHVKAFLGMLEDGHGSDLDADARELIRFALGSADCMQRLLTDLLQFSRIETEPRTYKLLELSGIVNGVVESMGALRTQRKANIECVNLPQVMADAQQMAYLFEQAIGNAIYHNRHPEPEVWITASKTDGMQVINILDNGETIDQKHHEAVFEMFYRLEGKSDHHTGAGLAIARRIARRHGGDLYWEESERGGNCLSLQLPLEKQHCEA